MGAANKIPVIIPSVNPSGKGSIIAQKIQANTKTAIAIKIPRTSIKFNYEFLCLTKN